MVWKRKHKFFLSITVCEKRYLRILFYHLIIEIFIPKERGEHTKGIVQRSTKGSSKLRRTNLKAHPWTTKWFRLREIHRQMIPSMVSFDDGEINQRQRRTRWCLDLVGVDLLRMLGFDIGEGCRESVISGSSKRLLLRRWYLQLWEATLMLPNLLGGGGCYQRERVWRRNGGRLLKFFFFFPIWRKKINKVLV